MTEAQDELRQERAKHYARKYGPYVAIFIVLILIIVGGKQAWHAYNLNKDQKNTVALLNSVDSIDALTQLSSSNTSAQGAMAGLIAYSRMDDTQKSNEGMALLNNIASDNAYPELWRDYATLVYVRSALAFQEGSVDADALLEKLKPLTNDDDKPFYAAAIIEQAVITGILKQDKDTALSLLNDIRDKTLPAHLSQKRDDLMTYFTFLKKDA